MVMETGDSVLERRVSVWVMPLFPWYGKHLKVMKAHFDKSLFTVKLYD